MNEKINILILCPSKLTNNWYYKMLIYYGIEFKVWSTISKDYRVLDKDGNNMVLCGLDSSKDNRFALDRLVDEGQNDFIWDLIVIDEAHSAISAENWSNIIRIKCHKCISATATPVNNARDELDKLVDLTWICTNNQEIKPSLANNIEGMLYDCGDDYPFTRFFKEVIKKKARKRKLEQIEYRIGDDNNSLFSEALEKMGNSAFDYYQNCSNLALLIGDTFNDNKLRMCKEKVEELLKEKHRILIFCRRTETVFYLEKELKKIVLGDGTRPRCKGITANSFSSIDERKTFIQNANKSYTEDSSYNILISIASLMSEGYDMDSFDVIINYELPWTPSRLEQRLGRIDRLTGNIESITMFNFHNTDFPGCYDDAFQVTIDYKIFGEVLKAIPSKPIFPDSYLEPVLRNIQLDYLACIGLKCSDYEIKKAIELCGQVNKDVSDRLERIIPLLERGDPDDSERSVFSDRVVIRIKEDKRIIKAFFGLSLEDEENNFSIAVEKVLNAKQINIANQVFWIDQEGNLKFKSLDEICNAISTDPTYEEIDKDITDLKDEIKKTIESIEEMIDEKGQERVLTEIWEVLSGCNIVYCRMIFFSIWQAIPSFSQLNFEKYILLVNNTRPEVI